MSKEIWDTLVCILSSSNKSQIMDLQTRLMNFKKGSLIMDAYVQGIQVLSDELSASGDKVDDSTMILIHTHGLGSMYNPLILSVNANINNLNFEGVIAQLQSYESTLTSQIVNDPNIFPPSENFLQSRNNHINRGRGQYTSNTGRGKQSHNRPNQFKKGPRCLICSRYGHWAADC